MGSWQFYWLLTQSHAKAKSPCKVQALGGMAGALQRRDLGFLEHIRDRLAALHKKYVERKAAQQCKGTGEKRYRLLTTLP